MEDQKYTYTQDPYIKRIIHTYNHLDLEDCMNEQRENGSAEIRVMHYG